MAVKVQVPKKAKAVRFALHPLGKILLVLLVLGFTTGLAVFTFYYVKYSRLIETKLLFLEAARNVPAEAVPKIEKQFNETFDKMYLRKMMESEGCGSRGG